MMLIRLMTDGCCMAYKLLKMEKPRKRDVLCSLDITAVGPARSCFY